MRMGIDESRQHRGAVKVVDRGVLARRGARSGLIADESDAVAPGDDRLDGFGGVAVHRDDLTAAVESRVLCGGGRGHCQEQRDGGDQFFHQFLPRLAPWRRGRGPVKAWKSTRLNSSHLCASRMPSSACKKKKKY